MPETSLLTVHARITLLDGTPDADFAIFTPFNTRFAKQLKFNNFLLQPDGSFKSVEVPGLPSFDA